MKRLIHTTAIALMVMLLFSAIPASASGTWTAYGRGDHASAAGDAVSFRGHPMDPFVSMLYRAATDGDYRTLTWHLTEGRADWHTIEGAGFVFNCGISGGYMNGYAVMFGQANVYYYKLTNASVSAMQNAHFTALPGVQLIKTLPRPAYSSGSTWYLKLTMSPGSVKFEKFTNPGFSGTSEIILQDTINDKTGGTGYGPFASFIAHNCPSISQYAMEYFNLTITPNTPPSVTAPDVTLNRGASFSATSGVSASDKEDGNLTSSVQITANNVNTAIPGVYNVTYAVTDLAGASANHTRKVTVLADALFVVTDDKIGASVPGVEITVAGQGAKTGNANGETGIYVLPPASYSWSVTGQHKDYLPLTGTFSANITKDGTSAWPMRIPVKLTRKTYDVGVALGVDTQRLLQHGEVATLTLTVRNNGNVASIPAIKLTVPAGLRPTDTAVGLLKPDDDGYLFTPGSAIPPGEEIAAELMMRVVNIAETGKETVTATLAGLQAEGTAVMDGNSANNTASASVSVKNPPVILTKIDALTGKPLAGVSIAVTSDDGKTVYTGKSNASGQWVVHGLIPGEYAVTETAGLPGYAKAPGAWSFTRNIGLTVMGDTKLTNSPLTLEIVKTDAYTKQPIEGVVFSIAPKGKPNEPVEVTRQENGEWYAGSDGGANDDLRPIVNTRSARNLPAMEDSTELTTDRDGAIVLRYLPAGEYVLTEKTPIGYAVAKPLTVKIGQDNGMEKPVKTAISNSPTEILLIKTDGITKTPLEGIAFSIAPKDSPDKPVRVTRREDGVWIAGSGTVGGADAASGNGADGALSGGGTEITTDRDGRIVLRYLPVGDYILTEKTPAGYAETKPQNVTVGPDSRMERPLMLEISNLPTEFNLSKTDANTKTPMEGVVFTVAPKKNPNTPIKVTRQESGAWIVVSIAGGGADGVSGNGEGGASGDGAAAVSDNSADGGANGAAGGSANVTVSGTEITTDKDGKIVLRYLPIGEYILTEKTPVGYATAKPLDVKIGPDNSVEKPVNLAVSNDPTAMILTKTDAYTKKPMEGVVFTVAPKDNPGESVKAKKRENGEWAAAANGGAEIVTDKDGKIVLRYLPVGEYILTEKTPAGYAIAKPVNFKVGPDNGTENPVKVEINNLPTKLVFEKLDALTGKPMRPLSVGKYSSVTTTVSTGTTTAQTGVTGGGAAVSPAATATDISQIATSTTYKQDGVTADSAVFRLLDGTGVVVKLSALEGGGLRPSPEGQEQFSVDANGICDILYLPVGVYTVEEMSAATGYGVAQPIKAEVTGENSVDKPTKARMTDSPLALRILKEKKSGGALAGAGFTLTVKGADKALTFTLTDGKYLYDPEGRETVLKVDDTGVALAYYLPAAEYILTETVTPEGYFNAPPVPVKIALENTTEKPAEVKVINELEVKLGLDSDRWRVAGAAALIFLSIGGLLVLYFLRRKEGQKHGA